jgi:hypothetical protein
MKWELEDRSFEIPSPQDAEIKAMVADHVPTAGRGREASGSRAELKKVDIPAERRPREALIRLRQDGQEGSRVQRDLRPDRDAL